MKIRRDQPKHLNKENGRRSFPVTPLLAYLLVAVTLTTGVSFSRYTFTVSSSDSARVAKWDVQLEIVSSDTIDANKDQSQNPGEYTFKVKNESEVPLTYSIQVEFTTTVPKGISLRIGNQTYQADGNTKSFFFTDNSYRLNPKTETESITLYIEVTSNDLAQTFTDSVKLNVLAEQID